MFVKLGFKLVFVLNLSWWLGLMNDCKNFFGCELVLKKMYFLCLYY